MVHYPDFDKNYTLKFQQSHDIILTLSNSL